MKSFSHVVDSQGIKHVDAPFTAKITDVRGKPVTISVNTINVDTPQGKRLMTTVALFPGQSDNGMFSGEYGVYTGSTLQSPDDPFDFTQAVKTALKRAMIVYLGVLSANRSGRNDEAEKWVKRMIERGDIDRALDKWSQYVVAVLLPRQGGVKDLNELLSKIEAALLYERLIEELVTGTATNGHSHVWPDWAKPEVPRWMRMKKG